MECLILKGLKTVSRIIPWACSSLEGAGQVQIRTIHYYFIISISWIVQYRQFLFHQCGPPNPFKLPDTCWILSRKLSTICRESGAKWTGS